MKKLFLALTLMFLLVPILGFASPFLVCNPQAGVETYTITGDVFFTAAVTAQTDGSLRADLAGIAAGSHAVTIAACNVWGCSSTVPFVFTKTVPNAPAGVSLGK